MTASAIYEGTVHHRRLTPVPHAFRYRMFMMYLDLDEMDAVFRRRWLWSCRRPAAARFHRADHFGDVQKPLAESVRQLVQSQAGFRPGGPIRLLTHLRYFGYCFNPISMYYCFDEHDREVTAMVAEVSNTPWGERHCYVLSDRNGGWQQGRYSGHSDKQMHVSPFMDMDMDYAWSVSLPGRRLVVHIENRKGSRRLLDATLDLQRREITGGSLARALVRFPFMTARVMLAIHLQAARLWLKRVPVQPHPAVATGPSGRRKATGEKPGEPLP